MNINHYRLQKQQISHHLTLSLLLLFFLKYQSKNKYIANMHVCIFQICRNNDLYGLFIRFFDSADLAEFTKENLVFEQQQTSRNGYKRPLILGINMDSFILCCQNITLPGQYDKINYCVHCVQKVKVKFIDIAHLKQQLLIKVLYI